MTKCRRYAKTSVHTVYECSSVLKRTHAHPPSPLLTGVCPQHDILYPFLTVEEHLLIFAAFKGLSGDALKIEVETMIQAVGLTEKRKAQSRTLSGGQKRKLSVAIAFVGGSKVVFLDEPTSGMDPYSRRFTWNVIRSHREGRAWWCSPRTSWTKPVQKPLYTHTLRAFTTLFLT